MSLIHHTSYPDVAYVTHLSHFTPKHGICHSFIKLHTHTWHMSSIHHTSHPDVAYVTHLSNYHTSHPHMTYVIHSSHFTSIHGIFHSFITIHNRARQIIAIITLHYHTSHLDKIFTHLVTILMVQQSQTLSNRSIKLVPI